MNAPRLGDWTPDGQGWTISWHALQTGDSRAASVWPCVEDPLNVVKWAVYHPTTQEVIAKGEVYVSASRGGDYLARGMCELVLGRPATRGSWMFRMFDEAAQEHQLHVVFARTRVAACQWAAGVAQRTAGRKLSMTERPRPVDGKMAGAMLRGLFFLSKLDSNVLVHIVE